MAVTVNEYIPNVDEKPRVEIESDKTNSKWIVSKSNDGFIFYSIHQANGKVPKELAGHFSTMRQAVNAVINYERKMKPTPTRRRDARFEEREAK